MRVAVRQHDGDVVEREQVIGRPVQGLAVPRFGARNVAIGDAQVAEDQRDAGIAGVRRHPGLTEGQRPIVLPSRAQRLQQPGEQQTVARLARVHGLIELGGLVRAPGVEQGLRLQGK